MKRAASLVALALALFAGGARSNPLVAPSVNGARKLETSPPPAERSTMPTPREWQSAESVALMRPLPRGCSAHLIREWLRLECEAAIDIAYFGGPRDGVTLSRTPPDWEKDIRARAQLIVPLRRGERRIMQLQGDEWGHHVGSLTLSIQWLPDQAGPWVSLIGDAHYFLGGD
jgi:hypothetical protein